MNTNSDTDPGAERVRPEAPDTDTAAPDTGAPDTRSDAPDSPRPPERAADRAWLGTPSGIVALAALVLSVFLPPLFFPLACLALVLAIIALVRRRPRPRSAVVVVVISSVLIAALLAVGILATLAVATTEYGVPG